MGSASRIAAAVKRVDEAGRIDLGVEGVLTTLKRPSADSGTTLSRLG